LGWTISYIYCIFVHPDLDLALLFVGMRERSIEARRLDFMIDQVLRGRVVVGDIVLGGGGGAGIVLLNNKVYPS